MRPRNDKVADRRPYLDDDAEIGCRKDVRGRGTAHRTTKVVAACALVLACTCMAIVGWDILPSQSMAISLLTLVSPVGAQALRLGSLYAMHMPPRALMLARSWNVDVEIQGDCECERPYNLVTKILAKEIVCKCPYYFVPSEPQFPGEPATPKEVKYADGCVCVRGEETITKHTTCTCPIKPTPDDPDFDTYTDTYDPAKVAAEDAKKAAELLKENAAVEETAAVDTPPKTEDE